MGLELLRRDEPVEVERRVELVADDAEVVEPINVDNQEEPVDDAGVGFVAMVLLDAAKLRADVVLVILMGIEQFERSLLPRRGVVKPLGQELHCVCNITLIF